MFGTYVRRLDAKKRIAIPPKLKSDLGSVVFVTVGSDSIIEIRSKDNFNALCEKLQAGSEFGKDLRNFRRIFFGNTTEIILDKLGRILLPTHLLSQTAIKNDIVIIGVGNKLEVWPQLRYDKVNNQNMKPNVLEKLSEKLNESFGVK